MKHACWVTSTAFGLVACPGSDSPRSETTGTRGAPVEAASIHPGPADTITTGCSGGVTGGGNGAAVTGRGEILRWERDAAGQPTRFTLVRTDSAAAATAFAELERIGFRSIVHSEPSNMTCFLELADSAGRHEVSWPIGQPPAKVGEVSRRVGDLVETSGTANGGGK